MFRGAHRFACLLAALTAISIPARAQPAPYPTRTVEVIVAYGPGGSTDIVARTVAQKLTERLGQPFVILNRPGASGTIGIKAAMAAKPDGYTLYVGYTSETVVVPQISKSASYSVIDDFEPIAVTGDTRSAALPNVPTFKEAGVPEFDLASWTVMLAPKGTPKDIVDIIRK